ncbi:Non-specific serine/threonine protein kinase [Lentibacillus sp. JNUCC-1]|uniref:conserved virulence factor C family protein n=1 Tax=Lentibacillus sp. JNUCC-1 TaxID=2654513 RepID=UPI0012E974F9|nr:conserved virulence factor C family protein [Lentibacillus sp. JNUCC-1]MUV36757.1 Non-specific serine/threonine protein kinase [Lentibacillus sp. JNUCC-1]
MKIVSIEPTPSPHSMKVNMDETLADGDTRNFQAKDDLSNAPDYIQQLMSIEGVKGLYHVFDFITIQRHPKVRWEDILPQVRDYLGTAGELTEDFLAAHPGSDHHFGGVDVFIQTFRTIPMQVKLEDGNEERRYGLPERFTNAVMKASAAADNMLMERKWTEQDPRYGNMDEIGEEVVEEICATYNEDRLNDLAETILAGKEPIESPQEHKTVYVTPEMLDQPDWKDRYAALDQLIEPSVADLAVLDKALDDEKASVRRLATALLGMIEEPDVLPYLYKAMKDSAVNVRRTAGDCLSDLGFKEAIPQMIESLSDPNRLVRWRAAMFLYETGDESALPALQKALNDLEFEVRMQAKMALARIEDGQAAEGSIWQQMADVTKGK